MTPWAWLVAIPLAVLGWTWILYPIVVWLLSRLSAKPTCSGASALPTVTAILATRDDVATIVARVGDFLAGDYPADKMQVVVGVDAATPERLATIADACGIDAVLVVASDAEGGKAAGLNAAVRRATGDVLVFSDSQQRFAPDAIRVMVARLTSDPRLAAVGGALQLPGDAPEATGRSPVEWYWAMERQLRAAEARLHSTVGLSGSIYAMWRREWQPMPAQLILDDVWLPMRLVLAGRRVGYELTAKAWDARSTSAVQEKVRKVRTLTGNFQLMAWLPALLVPVRNPIWVQFVSHKVLRLLTPWLVIALGAGMVGVLWSVVPPSAAAGTGDGARSRADGDPRDTEDTCGGGAGGELGVVVADGSGGGDGERVAGAVECLAVSTLLRLRLTWRNTADVRLTSAASSTIARSRPGSCGRAHFGGWRRCSHGRRRSLSLGACSPGDYGIAGTASRPRRTLLALYRWRVLLAHS
ncbi:MAG: glycosyltransferase [Gemmatimonadaceae bacterium]|nr:glycosyltransferase [Gemmatimonadaceae bacterium]